MAYYSTITDQKLYGTNLDELVGKSDSEIKEYLRDTYINNIKNLGPEITDTIAEEWADEYFKTNSDIIDKMVEAALKFSDLNT
jgi:hypothetical protein